MDVSGSVSTKEYRTQMEGLAAALNDGAVSEALVVHQAEVMLLQWTGASRQRVSIPWTTMRSFEDTDALAAQVAQTERVWRNFSTAIGEALDVSLAAFDQVSHCARKVIDVSGDGVSNEGITPREVWARLSARGIVVNGLAIESDDKGLTEYFRKEMITGVGSFAVRAADFEDYPDRIRQKLLREITKQVADLKTPMR